MERAGVASMNSVVHGLAATFSGSMIDSFFQVSDQEDLLTSLLYLAAQNVLGGLAMSSLAELPAFGTAAGTSERQPDPTGGAYVLGPFFLSQPEYQRRLALVASRIRQKVQSAMSGMTAAAPPAQNAPPATQSKWY